MINKLSFHALRGMPSLDALRRAGRRASEQHSHAERGNEDVIG